MLAEARERSLNASLAVFPSQVLPAVTSFETSAGPTEQAEQPEQAERSAVDS
jgi:hypothetical protein